jgi:hypothetical protein
MGKSWKSTVSGAVSAAGMFIIFASGAPYNVHFPVWLSALAAFMALGGLASLGINAKDSEVTGGSIVQPGVPVAPVPPVAVERATPVAAIPAAATPIKPKW